MAAPELMDSAYRFETNDAPLLHRDLTISDLAHLLHLAELELIPRPAAQTCIRLLLELDTAADFAYDPQYGDAFTNRARWLGARAPEAAGYLAAGRARREATTVAFRLVVRRALLALARALGELEDALLALAARHIRTVMPDYTYLQQAQPTTFAHYILSFVYPLRRDYGRLHEAFDQINQSPAGIGSTNGSALPLNRERLAELLGFDGVIRHARDAMWQVDAPAAAVNAAALLLLHLDRLAEDLQIFNSTEFGFVKLAADLTRPSAIMPQKENPYPLAFVRGAAGSLIGRAAEMYVIARTPSAQVDNRLFAYGEAPRALDLAARSVKLMAAVCATLQVCPAEMARRVAEGFTAAADLAETLMRTQGLDYQTAHRVVGESVRELQAQGKTAGDLTAARLAACAREILGRPIELSDADVAAALDPIALVNARRGTGGAAPERVREMIDDCRAAGAEQGAWATETARRIEVAERDLIEQARRFSA